MIRWLVIYPLFLVLVLALSWKYLPSVFQEKLGAFIGAGVSRSTGTITNAFGEEIVLRRDPKERRETLIAELKKNVAEIRRQINTEGSPSTSSGNNETNELGSSSTGSETSDLNRPTIGDAQNQKNLLQSAEEIIDELEKANDDATVRERIVERILERFLPEKEVVCKVNN